jgi:formate dehydrogenase major subunit
MFMHSRLWQEPLVGPRVQFSVVEFEPPVDVLDESYPIRLTTGRCLDSFNTGVQTARYRSPLRRQEALRLSPEDGAKYDVADGERARISSRRGSIETCVRYDPSLRPGLAFLTLHHPEEAATNFLTIDAVDPESGTAEFKATAIRVDKLPAFAPRMS